MGVIINFHEVKDQVWLENNLCFLKERYNPVDLPELINSYNGKKELKSICHITVDDGSKSFYDNIYPVLKKHKIPASATYFKKPGDICIVKTFVNAVMHFSENTVYLTDFKGLPYLP